MDVPVSRVTASRDQCAVRVTDLACLLHELGDRPSGHCDVDDVVGTVPLREPEGLLARLDQPRGRVRRQDVHVFGAELDEKLRQPRARPHRAGRRGRCPCGRRGKRARSLRTSSGMPSSRLYSRCIAAIVRMSMYSRIEGPRPLPITTGTAAATSSSVGNGASTVALKAGRGYEFERRFRHERERALGTDRRVA